MQTIPQDNTLSQGTGDTRSPEGFWQKSEQTGKGAPQKPLSLKKELLGLLCLLLAVLLFCGAVVPLLTPKRHDYGAVWGMYTQEPEDSLDALFFGSSLAYCDLVPSILYEETGAAAFVMAGPEQTFPITYRYLREACKTQSPKTVFIEATGLIFGKSNRSIKANLTYMPWNLNRLIPVLEESLTEGGKTPEETAQMEQDARIGLLFPLYAYHDRWDELTAKDYKEGILGYEPDLLAGYTFLDQATPIEEFTVREFTEDPETYARNLDYAKRIVEFCREEKIRPVFFLSPLTNRLSLEWSEKICADLTALGVEFVDFNADFDEIGFDLSVDFYDRRHLNYRGAEKFTRYLSGRLSEWGVSPSSHENGSLWQERADRFAELRGEADAVPVKLKPKETGQ